MAAPASTPTEASGRPPSRPSAYHGHSSPAPSLSSASIRSRGSPPVGHIGREEALDDGLVAFDPRRFTPTLHASLVSEILSLRRENESKSKTIDELECSLESSREENDGLQTSLLKCSKESRSLRRELRLLEGGSSSALTELTKERDEALESISDLHRRLEQSQRKIRSTEEEVERIQLLWDRDRSAWESGRRSLDHKVHVVESRLQVVLNEIAAAQVAGDFNRVPTADGDALQQDEAVAQSDSTSIRSSSHEPRRASVTSLASDDGYMRNPRFSVLSLTGATGTSNVKSISQNLADELDLYGEEMFTEFEGDFIPDSPEALPEERPRSMISLTSGTVGMGLKARKILGLALYGQIGMDGYRPESPAMASPVESSQKSRTSYQDAGIQYLPCLSQTSPPEPAGLQLADHNTHTTVVQKPQMEDRGTLASSNETVSSSCQTVAGYHSPPLTPKLVLEPAESEPQASATLLMASVSTQTEDRPDADARGAKVSTGNVSVLEIPVIAIHPPGSEPPSPRSSVILPPQTKSVLCQTDISPVGYQSAAVQTEKMQSMTISANLLPSAIPDLPLGSIIQDSEIPYSRSPLRQGDYQAYPGNNDNGLLSEGQKPGIRRPQRHSSLFAGFEDLSDEGTQPLSLREDIFSDDELLNRPLVSYTLRRGKLVSTNQSGAKEVALPEIDEHLAEYGTSMCEIFETPPGKSLRQRSDVTAISESHEWDARKATLTSSGSISRQRRRSRSPSEPNITNLGPGTAPPIPVPLRFSSRKFPSADSDDWQSPTPPPAEDFSRTRSPSIVRRPTLRRVRSAAVTTTADQHGRHGSGSSLAMSISSYTPDSPNLINVKHPLPVRDLNSQKNTQPTQSPRESTHIWPKLEVEEPTTAVIPQMGVVDAIAQTMVGEWMFKYIRRRRSFNASEPRDALDGKSAEEVSASITTTGARHKRWVWLAPYECAIMWSNKQPASGPALLGKSGRKFTIQSVLDVKDDNPFPKGSSTAGPVNRSILILTPQRALKFTATSLERHYMWLTALSFLSHSGAGLQELRILPPVPQGEMAISALTPSLRKNPIRDSIRVAKGKSRPRPVGKHSFEQPPAVHEFVAGSDGDHDAADAPNVPRFSKHARKRSNTNPRIPTLRSFSSYGAIPPLQNDLSDIVRAYSSLNSHNYTSSRSSFSHRISETSGPSTTGNGNIFDAIPTVRMEAFVDRTNVGRYAVQLPHNRSSHRGVRQGFGAVSKNGSEIRRQGDPFYGF